MVAPSTLGKRASGHSISKEVQLKSVQTLQRAWKNSFKYYTTYRILEDYLKNGVTIERVKSISFEELVLKLKEKPVVMVSKRAVQRIHFLSVFLHGSPCKQVPVEDVNVRVILAANMIAYRPTHVFESMGKLEQELLETSIPLLETFEKICKAILSSERKCFSDICADLTKEFPPLLFEYLQRFKAWKIPDGAKLSCRIKHALIALYQAEQHLPADEPEDTPLKIEFRTQIERLRSKLQLIAGKDALVKFDEERSSGLPLTDACGTALGALPGGGGDRGGSGASNGGTGGAYAAIPGRMTNEQLGHELLLDPTFQLDDLGGCAVENPVFHRIRQSFHQAFWDSLVDDIKLESPCYTRVLRVLSEIRDGIVDLAGARESGNISDAVDIDFIRQLADKGLYGWEACRKLLTAIVGVIQRVQSTKRDAETKEKWKILCDSYDEATLSDQPSLFCKGLEFLLERVNAMRIDAANARLRLIAPVIRDHGIDYERGKLAEKIKNGSMTLQRTEAWICNAVKNETAMERISLKSLLEGQAYSYVKVHTAAMLSIVVKRIVPRVENMPETLLLDAHRLTLLQSEYEYIVLAVTMLVSVGHQLTPGNNSINIQVLSTISDQLVSESRRDVEVDYLIREICVALDKSTLADAAKANVRAHLHQCAVTTDAVHILMRKRIETLLGKMMEEGTVPQDVPIAGAIRPFLPRILKVAVKLRNVTRINRMVHMDQYNRMILESARVVEKGNKLAVVVEAAEEKDSKLEPVLESAEEGAT